MTRLGHGAVVTVERVTKSFGGRNALTDVSLTASSGLTVVLGANGSGKTTLLRCIATVSAPTTGKVVIDGLEPHRERDRIEIRRRLGYAPQRADFDDRARVFDAVEVVAVMKGIRDDRRRRREVFDQLDRAGLADRARDRVGDLSGGLRRRLVVAQAMLGEPTMLVLDEPAAGADRDEHQRQIELVAAQRRRTTTVLATHDADDAHSADAIVVLDRGRCVFSGSPERLAGLATGRVWVHEGLPPPTAQASQRAVNGTFRCIGTPPPGAALTEPTVADGYALVQAEVAAQPAP